MNRIFVAVLALSLLILAAGSAAQAAPRSIPWDCSDWQESPAVADADDARVSMILESLAANRGKSIYCAIDQSDTWTKAETWAAGRDRNERDDTVYFGESGNFRGFLSAQEGYLTDGESGVTGVSRELIFEFPREERRRRWRTIVTDRLQVAPDNRNCYSLDGGVNYWPGPTYTAGCRQLVAPFGPYTGYELTGNNDVSNQAHWPHLARTAYNNDSSIPAVDWAALARDAATAYCANAGYQRVRNVVATDPPLSTTANTAWVYQRDTNEAPPNQSRHRAAPVNSWSATCQNTKRVRR